ncbi:hypothetical protein F2P81_010605 [Scophthalmus maximus]|uniref:Transmembrane channel-like protein n=1 Tax=Scophthalmus maximus TaxID=52904 RepID=A0A6A4T3D8_SCOMX|nr:hypothetical protein F2P81_010605 [Scophthalmus maximus]
MSQSQSYLNQSPVFYGFYTRGSLNFPCLHTPLLYFAGILTILFLSLAMVVRRMTVGLKHTWLLGKRYSVNVSYKIFRGWDFTIQDPAAGTLKQSFIRNDLKLFLEEQSFSQREAKRTLGQRVRLYLLRFILNVLVVSLLGGAFYLIFFATETSLEECGHGWFVSLFLQYLAPITITFVNLVLPNIFRKISSFEDYSLTTQHQCKENRFGREICKLSIFNFLAMFFKTFLLEFPRKSSCGPFGNGETLYNVTGVCVDSLPSLAQSVLRYMASEAFAVPLILTEISGKFVHQHNSRVAFRCIVSDSSPPITYELMGDGGVPIATGTDLQGDQPASFFLKVAATSEGSYRCKATTEGSTGVSNIIKLSVVISYLSPSSPLVIPPPAYVSKPKISFSIFKEGDGYRGNVTCWSPRGSPPVNFSLSVDDKEIDSVTATESLVAWFPVAMVPGLDMGVARCRVKTEIQELMSEPVTLEVVPVGGDVKVEVEYFYRADSRLAAASLSCLFSRGTFPYISWLLNDSVLLPETHADTQFQPVQPHFALANRRHSLVLTMLTSEETGYYRCRVRDSYDDSGPWVESVAVLVRVTELFITTTEAISIAFCCFLLLMLAVGVACVYRMFALNHGLCHCSKDGNQTYLGIPRLFGPSEALVGDIVIFKCQMPKHQKNEFILLQLFKKGNNSKWLGESTSLSGEAGAFNLVIRPSHDGSLECVARAQNNSNIQPTASISHYLKVVEPVNGSQIVVRSGPVEFFEGDKLELLCKLTAGNYVSYKWLLNGRLIAQSPGLLPSGNHLLLNRTTSEDSGSYVCVATNHFKDAVFTSRSSDVEIIVKDVVSAPDISFTVLKEESQNYSAAVTCQSSAGTPPVTFTLYNRTELVGSMTSQDRGVAFKLPLFLGQYLGELRCEANNGGPVAHSQWLPLEVVSVGGPVTMHYDYDVGENFAVVGLRLYCRVAKGSHPRYRWFQNKTLLRDRGSFYYVANQPPEQSILLLSVGRSSAGTYRCEVSDSFDNTTAISSRKRYLDKEGRRQYGERSLLGLEMERTVAYEGELDLSEYEEDADVLRRTTGGDEFDRASEASADEWPRIAEQRKTLEDEPFEAL